MFPSQSASDPSPPPAAAPDASARPASGSAVPPPRVEAAFPRTLRVRLSLIYALVVVVVMSALGLYLAGAVRDLYVDRLSRQLEGQARLVGDSVTPLLQRGAGVADVDPIAKRQGNLLGERVTVIAPDGTVLGESSRDPVGMENHRSRSEVAAALRGGVGIVTRTSSTVGEAHLYVAVSLPDTGGAVARVAAPLDQVDAAVGRVQRDLAVATLVATVLVVAVGSVVAGRIAGPLDDLRFQTRAIAAGKLDVTVLPAGTHEVGELGRAFNEMTRQLRASREEVDRARLRLETTLASLSDGVIITDEDGALLRMNGPAVQLLGLPAAPPSGLPFVQVSRDHELAALLRDALAAPDGSPRFAVVDYGRSRRVLEATAQRLAGAEERLGLVVLRDVTELRRLERVRREFVANVSHELRTPLASIKALVETLEAGAMEDPAVAGDFLHRIVAEVDRLAGLVDELLDLARLDSGRVVLHPEPLDPGELLARAAERLRPQTERARLALELRVPPDLPPVRADRARVEQVMLNLLHNAIKFTPPEGTITVTASVDGQMLEVAVRDTGVGVAEDELPRLFERFYKADKARRSDGTGLGLAIAKHIVQAHGGTIWAESRPGEGATVRFTLPLAADGDAHPPAGVANGDRTAGRARPEARRRAD